MESLKRPMIVLILMIVLIAVLTTVFNGGISQFLGTFVHKNIPKSITVKMGFMTKNYQNDNPIGNVRIVMIKDDGEVIGVAVSNEKGIVHKEITVPLDKRYLNLEFESTEDIRGTITLIAYKEGYRETILYNAGVSIGSSFQPIYMKTIVPGWRNEPEEQIGNNHHIETCILAEKYSKYAGKEVEY
ncbi:hypothetical protein [Pseudobacteroides cellulosolvens]|uniref:Uncharacterized protein n=1 Tax=Pseudobacteroides cellulosolvens ATCC 35603 = DSM 2933 TaxID=398512 RepID=A0A0L6JJC8_9FIRM|nr:hypothetical protein [Pseudobacteroides cellulosolvens]KNY25854.1 hypothetical protein Bccel_1114 [Pseudobacteroides cellulosolvens ATCC 35603 = DSM 2933]